VARAARRRRIRRRASVASELDERVRFGHASSA
jgi:hypothetical protein